MINKIKNNKVLSNISWILFGKLFYMVLNFIVGILSARFLGPSNYGLIGYAAGYITFFSSICNLGINSVILKELLDNVEDTGKIIGTSIICRFISSLLSLVSIFCICFFIDFGERNTILVVFLYSIAILFQIFEVLNYWFQSKLESKYVVITTSLGYIIMCLYKIILLVLKKGVEWFAISNSIEYFIIALSLLVLYKIKGGQKLSFSKKYALSLLNKSKHFIISGLMISIYNSTDKFMLKQMIGDSEVAFYSTALTLTSLTPILLNAIIDSLTPGILKSFKTDRNLFCKKNVRLYSIVFYISIFSSLLICLLSDFIVTFLYGSDYFKTVSVLNVLTWYTAFSYLGVARNSWIISLEKQAKLKYIYVFCAFLNVILNFLFIPLIGATGAALATLITQISTIFIFPLIFKELRENVVMMFKGILFPLRFFFK